MLPDPPSRELPERTGKHFCVRCLAVVPPEEYLRNDYLCDECAVSDEYPLASTPEPKTPESKPESEER
jgi:hypothetical protein